MSELRTGWHWVRLKPHDKWWQIAFLSVDGWRGPQTTRDEPVPFPNERVTEVGGRVSPREADQ